jgi:hypothetical protein
MDAIFNNLVDEPLCGPAASIAEHRSFSLNLPTMLGSIATSSCVTKRLDTFRIMNAKDGLHKMRQRMVVEVGRDIAHLQVWIRWRWRLIYSRREPWNPQSRTRDAQTVPL